MSKKIFVLLLLICLTICSFSYADIIPIDESDDNEYLYGEESTNSQYQLVIEDDANLLSQEETQKLRERMTPLTEFGHIIFKSINENNANSTRSYAENYYFNRFQHDSGSMLLIDMDEKMVYIVSEGSNKNSIDNGKSESITDNIYKYLSQKNYFTGADIAFSQMNTVLSGQKIAEPMKYISNIIIAFLVSSFITFFFIMRKSDLKKASNKDLVKDCVIAFSAANILGSVIGTTKKYSPQSSSSSSSGGGGFSGGGRRWIFW